MSQDALSQKPIAEPKPIEPEANWIPLTVWPAAVLIGGMVLFRFLPQLVEDGPPWIWMSAAFGPAICGILILLWWITFSGANWQERVAGFFGAILACVVTVACLDKSMVGPAVTVMTIPMGTAAFGIGAMFCRALPPLQRTTIALLLACLGFGVSALLRSDGMWGNFALGLHWRWTQSSEDRLAQKGSGARAPESKPAIAADTFARADWPGFRGPERDGVQHGSKIATDWSTQAPKQLWRISVGPGWSSFAVAGKFLFTQEQRGEMETVVCYAADSGSEIWTRGVKARFEDPLGGPGPRATPTLSDGALYVLFTMGQVMRLDPATGEIVWQAELETIANRKPPMWGFCSSPLVVGDAVIVHAGGTGDKGTIALSKDKGELKWSAPAGDHTYASPHLAKLLDKQVVLMLTNTGLDILDPATGAVLLKYEWPFEGYRALQPQVIGGDSMILPTPMGGGTRRIRVSQDGEKFKAEEVWTTRDLKPDFNDLVVFQKHAYGFDGAIFASIDLETGERNWKEGRYGKGEVLLLADSAALLVAGEEGEVILLKADPEGSTELGRFKAIEGRTWNHPVVIGDRLYIRNSQEAACYHLPLAKP